MCSLSPSAAVRDELTEVIGIDESTLNGHIGKLKHPVYAHSLKDLVEMVEQGEWPAPDKPELYVLPLATSAPSSPPCTRLTPDHEEQTVRRGGRGSG